jgi:DNA mismatch repair ATPase MutS
MIKQRTELPLEEALENILQMENLSEYVVDIVKTICNDGLNRDNVLEVLKKYGIDNIKDIKNELLDLIIYYVNVVLEDNLITENEIRNVQLLKLCFKIKDGDLYTLKRSKIEAVLRHQLKRLYSDNMISAEEAVFNVGLQRLLDLSYDRYDSFKKEEVKRALEYGANITDLDTALKVT